MLPRPRPPFPPLPTAARERADGDDDVYPVHHAKRHDVVGNVPRPRDDTHIVESREWLLAAPGSARDPKAQNMDRTRPGPTYST